MALEPPKPLTHLAYRLPLTLAMRLEELCATNGDDPSDVVADFVEQCLDDLDHYAECIEIRSTEF
jgi:predicted DNA-binding protein